MFGAEPFRLEPAMPVQDYKTYQILSPLSTHWRLASCEEVDCEHYRSGWRVRVEGLPPEMVHTAKSSGRKYVEQHVADGETWLVFEAGQPCFKASQHRVPVGRPSLFLTRPGDWRGNPEGRGAVYRHTRPEFWFEDFAGHQDRIATQIEKG